MTRTISSVVGQKPSAQSLLERLALRVKASLAGSGVFVVPNQSMVSTLQIRELHELDRRAYQGAAVQHGDIVVYRSPKHDGLKLASRVIALASETVELRAGTLLINGVVVPEPYVDYDAAEQEYSMTLPKLAVPHDHVFLMGDFRDLSEDSRQIGPVPHELLVGRIVIKEARYLSENVA